MQIVQVIMRLVERIVDICFGIVRVIKLRGGECRRQYDGRCSTDGWDDAAAEFRILVRRQRCCAEAIFGGFS